MESPVIFRKKQPQVIKYLIFLRHYDIVSMIIL